MQHSIYAIYNKTTHPQRWFCTICTLVEICCLIILFYKILVIFCLDWKEWTHMTIKPTSTRVFLFTLYLHVIVHLRMESNFGMDRRREDPLQGQAQLRASRCCIATLGHSFLLLLTRNSNSSPICSVHIVLSYVQFVDSSWFKIVLSLNWKILQFLPCLIL